MSVVITQSGGIARKRRKWLPWLVCLVVTLLAAATMVLTLLNQPALNEPVEGLVGDAIFLFNPVVIGLVAALIVSNRPGNRIGWLLFVAAACLVTGTAIGQYAFYALIIRQGAFPGGLPAAWISEWGWTPQLALLALILLLYPTGTFVSPRWRLVAWAAMLAIVVFGASFALSRDIYVGGNPDAPQFSVRNPIGILDGEQIVRPVAMSLLALFPAIWIASFVSLIVRFRRSQGIERQQLKWFTYSIAVFLALQIPGFFINYPWLQAAENLASLLIPIAIGIAILKYRLYEIDLLINRTLVYAPLTAVLAGIFAASITLSQKLFVAVTGAQSDAATVLTTLIVVAAVEPVKSGLQRLVDSRFKEPSNSGEKLRALRMQALNVVEVLDPARSTRRLLEEAVLAFGAKAGAVYLGDSDRMHPAHTVGEWNGDTLLSLPIESDGHKLGEIALGPKRNGADYTEQDRELLRQTIEPLARAFALTTHLQSVRT